MFKPTKSTNVMLIIALLHSFITGCGNSNQDRVLIGAAIGTGIGAIAGGDAGSMVVGGVVGGGIGYLLGDDSEQKKADLAKNQELKYLENMQNSEIVWIENSNGSKTPVEISRNASGFVGPRNDHYASFPSESQLKPVYGF